MSILLFSCSGYYVRGNGKMDEVSKELEPFNTVSLSGKGIIHLIQGNTHSMTIRAEENIMRIMRVEHADNQVKISYKNGFTTENIPEFTVTLPDLKRIEIDGMARVDNEGTFSVERLAINISGKARCDMDLKGGNIDLRLGGNSIINLRGSCDSLRVFIAGAADVAAQQMRVKRAVVRLMGRGKTELYVDEFLDVELNGAGTVTYLGTPELKTRINGSGTISAASEQGPSVEDDTSDTSPSVPVPENNQEPSGSKADGSGDSKKEAP